MLKEFFGEGSEIGQSLVESSVAFIVLAFVLGGVVDLGRIYYAIVTLEDTAGEAALYVAIEPNCFTMNAGCEGDADSRARDSVIAWIDPDLITLSCEELLETPSNNCNNLVSNDTFEITVSYPFEFYTPIVAGIANAQTGLENGQITLTANASQTVIVNTPAE